MDTGVTCKPLNQLPCATLPCKPQVGGRLARAHPGCLQTNTRGMNQGLKQLPFLLHYALQSKGQPALHCMDIHKEQDRGGLAGSCPWGSSSLCGHCSLLLWPLPGENKLKNWKYFFPCGKFWLKKINKSPQKLFLNYLAFFFFQPKGQARFCLEKQKEKNRFWNAKSHQF